MRLKDKVIVIIGASQGFGKALAKAFKQENAQVVISSHDKKNLELTSKELSVDYFLADVNFFGYFYGCQIALSQMKKQNSGVIININSTAGLDGKPGISAYVSSKFAIKGLTESIRKEVEDLDIKVFGVFPGGMKTDIYKEKYPDDLKDYMDVDSVVKKVIINLKSENPEIDFVIKRPSK